MSAELSVLSGLQQAILLVVALGDERSGTMSWSALAQEPALPLVVVRPSLELLHLCFDASQHSSVQWHPESHSLWG